MKDKRRIFLFCQSDDSQKYGIGRYVREIENEIKQRKHSYCLIVVVIGVFGIQGVEKEEVDNITYLYIPNPFHVNGHYQPLSQQLSEAIFCLLNDLFSIRETDIFHFNRSIQHHLITVIKKNIPIKVIYTIHVSLWRVLYDNNSKKFLEEWNQLNDDSPYKKNILLEKNNCELADKVICLTKEMVKDVVEIYGISQKKVFKIFNGINIINNDTVNGEISIIKKELGLNNNDFIYLYVGRLIHQKGINFLIKGFKKIEKETEREIKLIIVGDGQQRAEFFDQSNDIRNKIIFTGYIPPQKVRCYYKIADTLVFPSLNEQNSYVMLEAMLNKIPMIVTDIQAFEILHDNVTCIKVNLDDNDKVNMDSLTGKMLEVINNNELREIITKNAHRMCMENFSSKVMFENTYRLILN